MHRAKKYSDTKRKIIDVVSREAQPMSISEIASKTGISWATVKTNVLELSHDDVLKVKKFGGNWIIWKGNVMEKETCSVYRKKGAK